jgi:RNA polymerase sigma factor (sigma-70 family)
MKFTNTLVDKFRKGNIRAHQYYYREWYPELLKDAVAATGNEPEAAEIVHDAFVRLWIRCDYFDTHNSISAFLHIHIRHSCQDFINHTNRHPKMQRALRQQMIGEQAAHLRDGLSREELLNKIEQEDISRIREARELFRTVYTRKFTVERTAEELHIPMKHACQLFRLAMQQVHLIMWK